MSKKKSGNLLRLLWKFFENRGMPHRLVQADKKTGQGGCNKLNNGVHACSKIGQQLRAGMLYGQWARNKKRPFPMAVYSPGICGDKTRALTRSQNTLMRSQCLC